MYKVFSRHKRILLRKKKIISIPLIIAYAFNIIYGFFYYRMYEAISFFDTSSYFAAAEKIIEGKPDYLRTPLYPLFLHLCESINKENAKELCVIIQIIVFYISMFFFFRLIEQFTSNKVMMVLGTICYGCMTCVINFNVFLLTESFSVSGTVIFAYYMVRFIKEWKPGKLTVCMALSFLLTMLRPSALYLYIVDLAALIILTGNIIRNKIPSPKKYLLPFAAYIIGICLLISYISLNWQYNHFYGLSYVSDMNKFYDVVQADIWQDNSDTAITASLREKQANGSGVLGSAIDTESQFRDLENAPSRIKDFNDEAIRNHRSQYIYYLMKKILIMGSTHMEYNHTMDSNFLKEEANRNIIWPGDLLDFNINFVYFTVLILIINIVSTFFTKKTVMTAELMIFLITAGQLEINILAGPGEFHRLNITCYPMSILLISAWAGNGLKRDFTDRPAP